MILSGGERGIRTLVTLRQTAFRELRDQPLCHLSMAILFLIQNTMRKWDSDSNPKTFTDFDWCRERDLNPHTLWAYASETYVSTIPPPRQVEAV